MEGLLLLSALSTAMFIGSYFSGFIPLAFSMSESKMRFVSIFGACLLVGTALSVIIPEGVHSIYEAETELHNRRYHKEAEHILRESAHEPPNNPPRIVPLNIAGGDDKNDVEISKASNKDNGEKRTKRDTVGRKLLQQLNMEVDKLKSSEHKLHDDISEPHEAHQGHSGTHRAIGVALVTGFIFMLIVDQITRATTALADGSRPRHRITATVGLVVHAAADGIALGTASATNQTDIQFIVFIAIMLHKAPASFGLVTFLMVEGLERIRIRRHLLIFSLSAPIAAIITYVTISQGGNDSGSVPTSTSTGILMLFSAGTFLYVATVHVLPEMGNSKGSDSLNGAQHSNNHSATPTFTLNELLALIVGACVPVILSIGHSH